MSLFQIFSSSKNKTAEILGGNKQNKHTHTHKKKKQKKYKIKCGHPENLQPSYSLPFG